MPQPEIVIVGPGRLGRTVAAALDAAGWRVHLCGRGQPIAAGAVTWLTVPDAAIAHVAALVPPGGVVLEGRAARTVLEHVRTLP